MKEQLWLLEIGTIFFYKGHECLLEGTVANLEEVERWIVKSDYNRLENPFPEEGAKMLKFHKKLGGKFQTKISYWIDRDTEVEVK
jgi:hypothetical protein